MFERFQLVVLGGLGAPVEGDLNGLKVFGATVVSAFPTTWPSYYTWDADFTALIAQRVALNPVADTTVRPLIIGAHSYGFSGAIRLARALQKVGRRVTGLLGFDGVPRWQWGMNQGNSFVVPDNVDTVQMYLRSSFRWLPPWSSEIKNRPGVNIYVPGGHNDIPANPSLHQSAVTVLRSIASLSQLPLSKAA